jgi:hypothetical protein
VESGEGRRARQPETERDRERQRDSETVRQRQRQSDSDSERFILKGLRICSFHRCLGSALKNQLNFSTKNLSVELSENKRLSSRD